jgi:hypothetical protein
LASENLRGRLDMAPHMMLRSLHDGCRSGKMIFCRWLALSVWQRASCGLRHDSRDRLSLTEGGYMNRQSNSVEVVKHAVDCISLCKTATLAVNRLRGIQWLAS